MLTLFPLLPLSLFEIILFTCFLPYLLQLIYSLISRDLANFLNHISQHIFNSLAYR